MSEDKKKVITNENEVKENEQKEISLENLDEVTGGSIRNVRYTKTTDITDSIKNKI